MNTKMQGLYKEIEELAVAKSHLDSKIAKITSSGVDQVQSKRSSTTLDVAEAQVGVLEPCWYTTNL